MSKALLALCLTLRSVLATVAQTTGGQLAGTVADPDNNKLAGATSEAANQDTRAVRRAISVATGEFVLTDLPEGTYRLAAAAGMAASSWGGSVYLSMGKRLCSHPQKFGQRLVRHDESELRFARYRPAYRTSAT
jgi:hypothetical protein